MTGRILWGLLIIALGVVWLLNNLGLSNIDVFNLIFRYWPLLLIYFGVSGLVHTLRRGNQQEERPAIHWGSVLINALVALLGLNLLASLNGWLHVDAWWVLKIFFPLVLITAGVTLLLNFRRDNHGGTTHWAVMSGIQLTPTAPEDSAFVIIMGGADLNLSRVQIPEGDTIYLDLFCLMGGAKILVPAEMGITCHWSGILGGVGFFGNGPGGVAGQQTLTRGERPQIIVRAQTILGGLEFVDV